MFDGFYVGFYLRFLTGDLAGQQRRVSGYDQYTRLFRFSDPFPTAPATGDRFELVRVSTEPVTIPLELLGIDNHLAPGDLPTISPNPINRHVTIAEGQPLIEGSVTSVDGATQFSGDASLSAQDGAYTGLVLEVASGARAGERAPIADYIGATRTFVLGEPLSGPLAPGDTFRVLQMVELADQVFLFDTGAQLSTISTDEALRLGFDLDTPEFTISVQGAAGVTNDLPGFLMDRLSVPTIDGGSLTFTNVPVFVIDVGEGVQGLMGMNLFNNAGTLLYDPFDPVDGPSLQVNFFTERAEVAPEQVDTSQMDPVQALLVQQLAEVMPAAFAWTVGLGQIEIPTLDIGVDLDFLPVGVPVSGQRDGVPVVTVAPGQSVTFWASVPTSIEPFDAFQLDFSGSDTALRLHDWTADPTWPATDGQLDTPADTVVAGTEAIPGGGAPPTTLGTFIVDAPAAPGEYLLTADSPTGSTFFQRVGSTDHAIVQDYGTTFIRVQAVPELSVQDVQVVEGDSGATEARFTVALTGNAGNSTVTVDYTTQDGTATEGSGDYTASSGTLIFAPGETEQTIVVPIAADTVSEPDESFFVELSNANRQFAPLSVTPWGDVSAVASGSFPPTYTLENQTATELHAGSDPQTRSFAIEFDLSGLPNGATVTSAILTFTETTDSVDPGIMPASLYGYAGYGATDAGGNGIVDDTVFNTLLSNQIGLVGDGRVGTTSVDVTAFVQDLVTASRSFAGFYVESLFGEYYIHSSEAADPAVRPRLDVQFTPSTGPIQIARARGQGTILNDDASLRALDRQQPEGDSGTPVLPIVVQLDHASTREVQVDYTTQTDAGGLDPATPGDDFTAVSGTLTFAPGETSKTVLVPIIPDTVREPHETFQVVLSNPTNAVLADPVAVGTILNDDSATLMIGPADWPDSGLTLFLDGPDLRIVETDTLIDVRPAEDFRTITTVIVTGRDGFADTLTLDFIGGAPIPIDGLTFDGGAGSGIDTLVLENGAATTIAHEFIDASSGNIQIDGLTVNYLGLEPIEDNLDAIDRRFTYGPANDVIVLSDDGAPDNGLSQLVASGTAETVVFFNPGRYLTIDAGGGRDRVAVQSLDSQFAADIRINGNDGRDTLVGGALAETLDGGPGDDRLLGLGGNDSLLGGDGNDYLRGYGGNDTLDGGAGDDFALGTDGDDLLIGGEGADTLDGQTGNDSLFGAGGDDSLVGRSGNDYLDGQGSSRDTVWGGDGDDTLKGGAGIADQLVERGNVDFTLNDTLLTGLGSDVVVEFDRAYLKGGAGDNRLDASGFSGRVTLVGAAGNDTLIGGLGRDRLIGNVGDDVAFGSASRDTLYGSSGDDTLYGQGSNDILRGGPGSDSLLGGAGIDNLGGGSDADTLDGQDGVDLLVESVATSPTRMYQLTDTSLSDLASPAVVDVLVSIEQARLYGSNNDDVLDASGFSGPTWLFGFSGNDTLVGGAGNDYIDAGAGNDGLSGLGGNDTLLGGTGDDTLLGGDGNDGLLPGAGTDTALGESGDDAIDADDGEADVVAKSGNGTDTSPGDTLSVDALDQVDEAFTNPGDWTWADGWP